jgi:hypothetical protein
MRRRKRFGNRRAETKEGFKIYSIRRNQLKSVLTIMNASISREMVRENQRIPPAARICVILLSGE